MTANNETLKNVSPVTITETAYAEFMQIIKDQNVNLNEMQLRIGVKGGGCSGLSYILGFDNPTDTDQHYQFKDLPIIMNKAHGMYLVGMEIDWVNGLNNRGFQFKNPNATNTCGCGSSFSA